MSKNKPFIKELGEKPYFIIKASDTAFYVAQRLIIITPNDYSFQRDKSKSELVLGRDIREIPLRGLSLLLEVNKNVCEAPEAVEQCRMLARRTRSDYVSVVFPHAHYVGSFIPNQDHQELVRVTPRLFVTI